ncbi:distal tail protein Dit [Lactobacillus sp. AN1001]
MYDFEDMLPRAEPASNNLPLEALCYAGKWLDREIPEFETLVVEGRGGFERDINAPDRVGNDGSLYLTSHIKSRKISVTFRLQCATIEQYNKAVEKLNQLTYAANVEVKFADDPDYHYIGTVENIAFDKPLLSTVGKIEINCPDPYKYSTPKTIVATSTPVTIVDSDLTYPQTPKTIEFTPNGRVALFEMRTNTGKLFRFNEAIAAGDKLTIDFSTLTVKIGTVQRMMSLQLSSNFSDFYIQNGATIRTNVSGTLTITYEVKRL